jgi:hypothetical protein
LNEVKKSCTPSLENFRRLPAQLSEISILIKLLGRSNLVPIVVPMSHVRIPAMVIFSPGMMFAPVCRWKEVPKGELSGDFNCTLIAFVGVALAGTR